MATPRKKASPIKFGLTAKQRASFEKARARPVHLRAKVVKGKLVVSHVKVGTGKWTSANGPFA